MLVCGWLAAVVFLRAGSREEVLAVARPVDRFAVVERGDVEVVRVAADPAVATVSASKLEEIVGRPAGVALVPGSLLSDEQLLDTDDGLMGDEEAAVGAVLSPQDAPGGLAAGDVVDVVVRLPGGGDAEGEYMVEGWVLEVAEVEAPGQDGTRVSLVVPDEHAPFVSAGAAEDRVSVAARGGS